MIKFLKTYLYKYLQKKPTITEPNKNINSVSHKNPYIQFILNKDNNIEISCGLEHANGLDSDLIIELSEKYAELLLGISNSLLKNDIVETLKKESKKSEDHQKILLIDNIISFYETLEKERLKTSAFYHLPVVLPSMAFREHQS